MPTVQSNNISLAYEQTGSGPHLLLIAGLGYGGWFWHKVVPGLAQHFTVTTFDNRGAGGSDKPAGPYTLDQFAADTAGLIEALGLAGATVLGHSLGGYIAQKLIYSRPELVGKLILASTNLGGMKVIPITPQALAVMTNRTGDPVEVIKRGVGVATAPGFAEQYGAMVQELIEYRLTNPVPPANYTAQMMAGAGTASWSEAQIEAHAAANHVPTLILFGEHDGVVPPGNAQLIQAKIPHAQIIILPHVGHIFPVEDAAATVNTIVQWIQQQNKKKETERLRD